MTRELLQRPLCALLRLFFRRIDVEGREWVPSGPVIFILNHPNALIDPLVLLCRAGRPVSFLAKEPLFRMPVIGSIVRAMDSIPVYRRMDQADTSQNTATFLAARQLLSSGGSLALFPEGTSHSDPHLKPFRTGAARIALGSQVSGLRIVPAGLFYTEKSRFRSQVLLCFGPPVEVPSVEPGPDGEPAPDAVQRLTAELERSLGALTLQADQHEALELAEAAERILHSTEEGPRELADRMELRRRLLDGYARLKLSAPDRLALMADRVEQYQAALDAARLTPERLPQSGYRAGAVLRFTLATLALLLVLLPLGVAGMVIHLPAWLAVDLIGRRYQRANLDLVSTVKVLAGLVFYPLTWIGLAWAGGARWGIGVGLAGLLLAPLSALVAIRFVERSRRLLGGARGLVLALTGRRRFLRLLAERNAIRDDLLALARELDAQAPRGR